MIDVFLVFMNEFRDFILHMKDARARLVCYLVDVYNGKTLLKSIDGTFIAHKLLFLDA